MRISSMGSRSCCRNRWSRVALGASRQAVGAVFRQTALRLGGGQALRAALQVRQNPIGGLDIFLVHTITPLNDSAHLGK